MSKIQLPDLRDPRPPTAADARAAEIADLGGQGPSPVALYTAETVCLCPGNDTDECPCPSSCQCWDEDDDEYDGPPPRPITTVPTGSYL